MMIINRIHLTLPFYADVVFESARTNSNTQTLFDENRVKIRIFKQCN